MESEPHAPPVALIVFDSRSTSRPSFPPQRTCHPPRARASAGRLPSRTSLEPRHPYTPSRFPSRRGGVRPPGAQPGLPARLNRADKASGTAGDGLVEPVDRWRGRTTRHAPRRRCLERLVVQKGQAAARPPRGPASDHAGAPSARFEHLRRLVARNRPGRVSARDAAR